MSPSSCLSRVPTDQAAGRKRASPRRKRREGGQEKHLALSNKPSEVRNLPVVMILLRQSSFILVFHLQGLNLSML
ncbi:hypothetical protein Bpfe_008012 [Biomphalaria pfeifferi]|uniref:Uncharacterized protein n=1 Tax=Biomphalaria pfeifferi TaxID=112525 RepID=A0AAD8BX94_BIOPF|nr:hypothetical protein Bpfe_008012 [Biomphalaria pfeifferi]